MGSLYLDISSETHTNQSNKDVGDFSLCGGSLQPGILPVSMYGPTVRTEVCVSWCWVTLPVPVGPVLVEAGVRLPPQVPPPTPYAASSPASMEARARPVETPLSVCVSLDTLALSAKSRPRPPTRPW